MAISEKDTFSVEKTVIETEKKTPAEESTTQRSDVVFVSGPYKVPTPPWWQGISSPIGILFLSAILMVALLSFGMGSSIGGRGGDASSATSNSNTNGSMSGMSMDNSSSSSTQGLPNATESTGNKPAKYVVDADGAKHFKLTAMQVMWEPVKGHRVPAYTLDGTVPGPVIHVTAGDHVRITLINHLNESTTMHWHGLTLSDKVDGVVGVGQQPIQPGQTYTYDFTIHDEDAGTHWYHSHDNDIAQVTGGYYGAFLVDPRPGSPQAQQTIHADAEYLQFISELGGYFVINGKSFPDTEPIKLKHGQTVRIRMIGASEMMHPMHLHGHTMNIVAMDGHTLAQPIQKDTIQVAPGETYDFTFFGWADPGSIYPFHCHILTHLMNPGQSPQEMGGLISLVEYDK